MRFDLQLLDFVECDKGSEKLAISASDKDLTWNEFKNEVEKLKIEILKLPQKQQEVLRLNMVEGYSLTAVAKLWHVSPQYVYNIKKRALQNLKTVLV